jgi:hypothetical protein
MTRSAALTRLVSLASISLFAAVAVYCFARISPPELLAPFQAISPALVTQTEIFGSAPSFFYTFALGLLIGLCASTKMSGRLHCLLWLSLVFLLESTQHPAVASLLVTWLPNILPVSAWELVGPYWLRGVFDKHDLLASFAGGMVALIALTYLSKERSDENY